MKHRDLETINYPPKIISHPKRIVLVDHSEIKLLSVMVIIYCHCIYKLIREHKISNERHQQYDVKPIHHQVLYLVMFDRSIQYSVKPRRIVKPHHNVKPRHSVKPHPVNELSYISALCDFKVFVININPKFTPQTFSYSIIYTRYRDCFNISSLNFFFIIYKVFIL
jgi:hypothetical protein